MHSISLIDPRQGVMLEAGFGLDSIGALNGVELPRDGVETDAAYRARLMERLWKSMVVTLDTKVVGGHIQNTGYGILIQSNYIGLPKPGIGESDGGECD